MQQQFKCQCLFGLYANAMLQISAGEYMSFAKKQNTNVKIVMDYKKMSRQYSFN